MKKEGWGKIGDQGAGDTGCSLQNSNTSLCSEDVYNLSECLILFCEDLF